MTILLPVVCCKRWCMNDVICGKAAVCGNGKIRLEDL